MVYYPGMRKYVVIMLTAGFCACATSTVKMTLTPQVNRDDACVPPSNYGSYNIQKIAVARFADSTERRGEKYVIHPKFKANPNTLDIYRYIDGDGAFAASAVERALLQGNQYKVVEHGQLDRALHELKPRLIGFADTGEAIEIGRLAEVDALLMGEVSEAFARYVHRTNADGAYIGAYVPQVSLKIRLVDVASGETVWDCGIARSARNYFDEPLVMSSDSPTDEASFALMGSMPEERIKSVIDAAARDAAAFIHSHK